MKKQEREMMTNMQCREFAQLLEQEPDGPLSASAAGHLQYCSNCRLLWDDLEGIRAAGLEWGAEQPAPAERVWVALRLQLESEGLIHEARRPAQPENWLDRWFGRWFGGALRPALAGASLSLLLVAAALLGMQSYPPAGVARGNALSAASGPSSLAADLNRTLDGDMQKVMASLPERNPLLATSLRKNLSIVDNLIDVCEKSVREQPDNPMAREYLYGAYQQKAVLLSAAMDSGILEGR